MLTDELSKAIADIDRILDHPNSVHEGELWEKFVGLRNHMDALRGELKTPFCVILNGMEFVGIRQTSDQLLSP